MPTLNITTHTANQSTPHLVVQGQPNIITAAPEGARYQIIDPAIGKAPQQLAFKRVGDDIYISSNEAGIANPDVIIKDYFTQTNQAIIGLSDTSIGTEAYFNYTAQAGMDSLGQLAAGEVQTISLGGQAYTTPWWSTATEVTASGVSTAGLIGLAAGAAGIAAIASASGDDDDKTLSNSNPVPSNHVPTITLTQTNDFTQNAPTNKVGAVVATYSTADADGDTVSVTLSDTTHYALDGKGNVTLTAAGLASVNSGTDLPAFSLTPNDGMVDGTVATVDPSVTHVDNTAPAFTSANTAANVAENTTGTTVYTAAATDVVDFTDKVVTYSLSGADASHFSIDAATGEVTLNTAFDYEAQTSYTFKVIAADASSNTSSQTVTGKVTNVDDIAPAFTSANTAANVAENTTGTTVYTAAATDVVDFTDKVVTYSLSGADASHFSIDAATGVVTLNTAFDYEAQTSYTFKVIAADASSNTSSQTVTGKVTNVDDIAPTLANTTLHYLENQQITLVDVNGTTTEVAPIIGTLAATDASGISGYRFVDTAGSLIALDSDGKVVSSDGYYTIDNQGNVRLTTTGGLLASTATAEATNASNNFETTPNIFTQQVIAIDNKNNLSAPATVTFKVDDVMTFIANNPNQTIYEMDLSKNHAVNSEGASVTSGTAGAYTTSDQADKLMFGFDELGAANTTVVVENSSIDTDAGDDVIRVHLSFQANNGTATIKMGTGDDSIDSDYLYSFIDSTTTIDMGEGDDSIDSKYIESYDNATMTIDMGDGADSIDVDSIYSELGAFTTIDMGEGDDSIDSEDIGSYNNATMTIDMGDGADSIDIYDIYSELDAFMTIDMGEGDDSIDSKHIGSYDNAITTIDMGEGDDSIDVDNIYSYENATTTINLGTGDDQLTISQVVANSVSTISITGGAGSDTVTLGDATTSSVTTSFDLGDAGITGFEHIELTGDVTVAFELADLIDIEGSKLYIEGTGTDTVVFDYDANAASPIYTVDSSGADYTVYTSTNGIEIYIDTDIGTVI